MQSYVVYWHTHIGRAESITREMPKETIIGGEYKDIAEAKAAASTAAAFWSKRERDMRTICVYAIDEETGHERCVAESVDGGNTWR